MKQFEICFIDDRHNIDFDDYGWQILVRPFVTLGLFFGGYTKGTSLRFDKKQTLRFKQDGKLKKLLGTKGLILTKVRGKIDTFDQLLGYVRKTNSDVYVIDIDLSEFANNEQEKQELKFGGLDVANILKDKPALKILYSAFEKTQEIRTTIHRLSNYITDIKLIEISVDEIDQTTGRGVIKNSSQQLLTLVEKHLQRLQIDIIQENLKQKQINKLIKIVESFELNEENRKNCIEQAKEVTISIGCDQWNLSTLFPKEINTIAFENTNDAQKMKNRIIEVLEADFRTLISKIANWHRIEQKINIAMDLDMTVGTKMGQIIEYDRLNFNNYNAATVRDFLGIENNSNNFTVETFKEKLSSFASTRGEEGLNIIISPWDSNMMVKEFGIYWGQLLYVFKIAVQNHIVYQKNEDNSYKKFEIKVSRENSDNLVITIDSGEIYNNSTFTIDNNNNKITFPNGRSIMFSVGPSEAIQPSELRMLNTEQISDILKIVCYLWRGEFEFKYGVKAARFTWDNSNRTFNVETTKYCNDNSIRYIIRLRKPKYYEINS